MKTPVQIVGYEILRQRDEVAFPSIQAGQIIAAIEAAGFVIVDPERVTEGMVAAAEDDVFCELSPTREEIASALRAAPKWSKGNEG